MTAASEVVRQVGISHCNNVRSLVDHAHAADSVHDVIHHCRQELFSFLYDLGYIIDNDAKIKILEIFEDIQAIAADFGFTETIDNYHSHHWNLDRESNYSVIRSQLKDMIGIVMTYKQLSSEASRVDSLRDEYRDQLIGNFTKELETMRQYLIEHIDGAKSRNQHYNPLTTPITIDKGQSLFNSANAFVPKNNLSYYKITQRIPALGMDSLGLPTPDLLPPVCSTLVPQGNRALYESRFNDRKTALNQPKYMYRVEQINDARKQRQREKAEAILTRLDEAGRPL